MIERQAANLVRERLRRSPAVGLIGPRQCGKTTLARSFPGAYFDLEVEAERHVRLTTNQLNKLVQDAMFQHSPPSVQGRRLRIYFATQDKRSPPTFVFFVNDPKLVHFSYQRYLENRIREVYPFPGTPILMTFRGRQSDRSAG